MEQDGHFSVGDKVFAKIEGCPPWPAIITAVVTSEHGSEYTVNCYAKELSYTLKSHDLVSYLLYKNLYPKNLNIPDYKMAIKQMETAIKEEREETAKLPATNSSSDENDFYNEEGAAGTRNQSMELLNSPSSSTPSPPLATVESVSEDSTRPIEALPHTGYNLVAAGASNQYSEWQSPQLFGDSCANLNSRSIVEVLFDFTTFLLVDESIIEYKKSNFRLVSDLYLQGFALYCDLIRSNKEVFWNMPPISRKNYTFNDVLLTKLPNGKCLALKCIRNLPTNFANEYSLMEYLDAKIKGTLMKRTFLENGFLKIENEFSLFEPDFEFDDYKIEEISRSSLYARQSRITNFMLTEGAIIELDRDIKFYLGLAKADIQSAVEQLSIVENLELVPLMLKKHPHVISTIESLQKYVGNANERGKMGVQEQQENDVQIARIRQMATDVYNRFAQLFGVTDTSKFMDQFNKEVEEFKKQVEMMNIGELVMRLTFEPNSLEAFVAKVENDWVLPEYEKIVVDSYNKGSFN